MRHTIVILIFAIVAVLGVVLYGRFTEREPERRPARDTIITQLERFIEETPHEISLTYYDFSDQSMGEINGNKQIFPASMIKTLFLLTAPYYHG